MTVRVNNVPVHGIAEKQPVKQGKSVHAHEKTELYSGRNIS